MRRTMIAVPLALALPLSLLPAVSALGAETPKEWRGRWTSSEDYDCKSWPSEAGYEITRKAIEGYDLICNIKSLTRKKDGSYAARMSCGDDGGNTSTDSSVLRYIAPDQFEFGEQKLKRCPKS